MRRVLYTANYQSQTFATHFDLEAAVTHARTLQGSTAIEHIIVERNLPRLQPDYVSRITALTMCDPDGTLRDVDIW